MSKKRKVQIVFSHEDIEKIYAQKKDLDVELIVTHANIKITTNLIKPKIKIEELKKVCNIAN